MSDERLCIDLGAGINKRQGFLGVDAKPFPGVDIIADLTERWPFEDDSVDEANASHVIEHFDAKGRIHFVNELYRVLKPGATCQMVAPHFASCRAYGDLTHQWPPVSEFWFYYLSAEWRKTNAPHNDVYQCNFNCTWGYSMHPLLMTRNTEYQTHAFTFWKEAVQDLVATLKKEPMPP